MKHGKSYRTGRQLVDRSKTYSIDEAMALLDSMPKAKFDETVDVAVRLNVNPRHADQMVRGTVVLPNGTGKTVRVLVITRGPKEKEAAEAGADMVGADEYLPKIKEGWTDCDVIIATPDMMGELGKLGRILGPRGLMPNPKVGTVTADVAKAVSELKRGRVEFRVEKAGIIQTPIGKASFGSEKLAANLRALVDTLMKLKPATAKGTYLKSITISTTHGPGVKVDTAAFLAVKAD